MVLNIYNIPASCSFVDTLAGKFLKDFAGNPEGLADTLILVPNRRTCLSLRDAFVRCNGLKPSILPRIIPIGEPNEDEIFLQTEDNENILEQVLPVVDAYERLFLLAKLIVAKPAEYGLPKMTLPQSLELAKALCELLDKTYNEQLSLESLKKIVPAQYATHWQQTLNFLKIISEYWPQILKERGMTDGVARKNALLTARAQGWEKCPPPNRVIAAGITAVYPGYIDLIKTILKLPLGAVYIHGLDQYLEEKAWLDIDASHPQYELKHLLDALNLTREEVKDLIPSRNPLREKLMSEVMRPASSTSSWMRLKNEAINSVGFSGIHLLNCADLRQEALAVALILRETLNQPGKTAALVTTNRELARRVSSALEQWNIKIDDSAGKPLPLTPPSIFLRLIISVVENGLSTSSLLVLAKNPYVRLGHEPAVVRRAVRQWERAQRTPRFGFSKHSKEEESPNWLKAMREILRPLVELFTAKEVDFKALLHCHLTVAEELSQGEGKSDITAQNNRRRQTQHETHTSVLWAGDDGKTVAELFSRILPKAEIIGKVNPSQYGALLEALLSSQTVRASYGTHPRLKILGPIEARFNHYDRVVIGGMNEGIWPKLPSSDPWMSRPMKKEFGMSLPEQSIGVSAGDFSRLACAPEAWLTRSDRTGGTPMNKSRWWLRLETVLKAYGFKTESFENSKYQVYAKILETPISYEKITPPAPTPPLYARPRKLSASAIEVLMRDPYEIFARKILHLQPLDELDAKLNSSDYGSLIHQILEEFNNQYPQNLPDNAYEELLKMGRRLFKASNIPAQILAFWWPLFEKSARWLIKIEQDYRPTVAYVFNETEGALELDCPGGRFTIQARADRLDFTKEGKVNIIDYKTGEPRSAKEVFGGYAPQLPIEGVIASLGGFKPKKMMVPNFEIPYHTSAKRASAGVCCPSKDLQEGQKKDHLPPTAIDKLIYWKLGEKSVEIAQESSQLLDETLDRLKRLIAAFDFESTPYLSRPNPKRLLQYTNYEHLARLKEWSAGEYDD